MVANVPEDISHTISLAVAPVFLLTAIGTTISVMTTRLSRIIDRARPLEVAFDAATDEEKRRSHVELRLLSKRARFIHQALTSAVGSALGVCLLIMVAFIGYLTHSLLGQVMAVLFIGALGLLVYALVSFLREIYLSLESLDFGLAAVLPEVARADRRR